MEEDPRSTTQVPLNFYANFTAAEFYFASYRFETLHLRSMVCHRNFYRYARKFRRETSNHARMKFHDPPLVFGQSFRLRIRRIFRRVLGIHGFADTKLNKLQRIPDLRYRYYKRRDNRNCRNLDQGRFLRPRVEIASTKAFDMPITFTKWHPTARGYTNGDKPFETQYICFDLY